MKGCGRNIQAFSDKDIEWFYRINESGLSIHEADLHMIVKDKNMPCDVKKAIMETFPELKKKKFWFG
jgi:hypothetical protein